MSAKTDAEVIVGGKVFTLSGYESEEYLQKVASYINNKHSEYDKIESFRRQTNDFQALLLEFNIADDYFKAKKQMALLEEELKAREDELCNIKHELIATQIKLDTLEKNYLAAKKEADENVKKVIRLETELKERERK
ncbi:MAG: cell division protein ZapA [Lachnospiraceae bacterium]|nr:cell division protein ZapA [Lachnospiraceae bacterium]